MIKADRKITSLKQLQGHIWRTGFEGQEIKGVVFDDVPPALGRWHASGIKVSCCCSSQGYATCGYFRFHISTSNTCWINLFWPSILAELSLTKHDRRPTYTRVAAEKPRGLFSGTLPTGILGSTCVDSLIQRSEPRENLAATTKFGRQSG